MCPEGFHQDGDRCKRCPSGMPEYGVDMCWASCPTGLEKHCPNGECGCYPADSYESSAVVWQTCPANLMYSSTMHGYGSLTCVAPKPMLGVCASCPTGSLYAPKGLGLGAIEAARCVECSTSGAGCHHYPSWNYAYPGCETCPPDAATAGTKTECHGSPPAGCHHYPSWDHAVPGCETCPPDAATAGTKTECHGAGSNHDGSKCSDNGNDCCAHEDWSEPQTCRDGYVAIPKLPEECPSSWSGCATHEAGKGCYGCYPPGTQGSVACVCARACLNL